MSIRPVGANAAELRASRSIIWGEKHHFNHPYREMIDPETTIARVRYFEDACPITFALCLRMRQDHINSVYLGGKEMAFETFKDRCSTFVYIPLVMEQAGTIEVTIKHSTCRK